MLPWAFYYLVGESCFHFLNPTVVFNSQSMLTNLSSTPPFASLLRKEADNIPSGLPASDSNLKKSPSILHRRVSNLPFHNKGKKLAKRMILTYMLLRKGVDFFVRSVGQRGDLNPPRGIRLQTS